jgi:hypothetical protein
VTGVAIQDEAARGKGYASATYRELAEWAFANGRQLWSDTNLQPESARIYESLKRRGYTVVHDPEPPIGGAIYKVTAPPEKPTHPVLQEVEQRIHEAQPQSRAEAETVAHEALEDIGNRQTIARAREELAQPTLPEPPPPAVEGVKATSSKDPLDKIPWSDADGNAKLVSAQTAARAGERETAFADIIRECK